VYRLSPQIKATHLVAQPDRLVTLHPSVSMVGDWRAYLLMGGEESMPPTFRRHEGTGRPSAARPSSTGWRSSSSVPSVPGSLPKTPCGQKERRRDAQPTTSSRPTRLGPIS